MTPCLRYSKIEQNPEYNDNTTSFSATWGWEDTPSHVHTYPNIELLASSILPLQLQNLTSLTIDAQWSYEGGEPLTGRNNFKALGKVATRANVALDMFFDADPVKASSTVTPAYEMMVWLASFGGVNPIGYSNGSVTSKKIGSLNL